MSDVSKSWFAVLNNPADHGYTGTPQEICEKLREEWITNSTTRTGAWAYCVSASGLHHIHAVLEDTQAMRFQAVRSSYAIGMHFEATKGSKAQAEDYINKRGKFEEKGEQILYLCRAGEIKGRQGHRSDLEEIAAMLEAGQTPADILSYFPYRKFERMIRAAYLAKRLKETPIVRDIKVHYLVGEPGTGKSYTYVELCQEHGEENVYLFTDYDGGGWDAYQSEAILFIDELKGQLSHANLLLLLDPIKKQIHARYTNSYALWTEVYITSVFPPEELYQKMVEESARGRDKQQQLFRRITDITLCFVDAAGDYQKFTIPMSEYHDYEELKARAFEKLGAPVAAQQFADLEADDAIPF